MIHLNLTFDLQRDVISSILKKEETSRVTADISDPRILSLERDGGVLYCWRGATGTTRIGKYDPCSKHNKLLYTFDKQVCVSSCSLNKEETLLAVSLTQQHRYEEHLRPVSKCLTLLIEIHPINNTQVLKAVNSKVKVQFLHPDNVQSSVLESHLLLITEDGYVDQFHIMLARHDGYRVVMLNQDRLARDRVAEEFSWVQWDSQNQRLFYITTRERHVLKCLQFHPQRNCEIVFELPLELPCNPFSSVSFVHLGFDHYCEDGRKDKGISLVVFTDKTGSMCVCYSHPISGKKEVRYTIAFVHKGCSKTFTVALNQEAVCSTTNLQPLFFHTGYYVVVFLAGHFLHLLNTRQQDLLCYSFFLSGTEACLGEVGGGSMVGTRGGASLLDLQSGRMYTPTISPAHLMDFLQGERPEAQRLATLQCMLVQKGAEPGVERQVIDWICGDVLSFESFDQIQECILASLYRIAHQYSLSLDMVLPYSSIFEKKELPVALTMIPGVKCTPDLLPQPLLKVKSRDNQGFWAELQCVCERVKYFETVPSPRFRFCHIQEEWNKLQAELSSDKRRASHQRHLEENTKKVLSMVDTCQLDRRVVPLFQEEDPQQKALIGLMVDKLRDHLNRHLPQLGKKRTDALVVNYVAKLLELVHHMLETLWHKTKLGPQVFCLKRPGSPEEWSVFHVMLRILEATKSLCIPLPPGYNSILSVLGVKCVCRHSFLQFVDQRLLQLTEPFVSRLMKDLDNSDVNEALKFSILKRLPESMLQRVCHLWDHPVSSACISREYVRNRLQKRDKSLGFALDDREHFSLWPDFLPLSFLTKVLSDLEEKALNPFEEQENVDARFVEETALKQTLIQLGLEDK